MPTNDSKNVPSAPLLPGQRWSLARKREVALRLLRGEPIDALSRESTHSPESSASRSTASKAGAIARWPGWTLA
jgi:hypothetical protein